MFLKTHIKSFFPNDGFEFPNDDFDCSYKKQKFPFCNENLR